MSVLLRLLNKGVSRRIAVIGDVMLDSYIWGKVERISPEAPIPVVQIKKRSNCPGGAANVMRNIVTLGAQVYAFGVVGDDPAGKTLTSQLEEYGISTAGISKMADRPTTVKQRVISSSQQLLRIDEEDVSPIPELQRDMLKQQVITLIETGMVDAVVLEDYAKGVLSETLAQEIVDAAACHRVLTLMDPNPNNSIVVKNLTLMKPNRAEAFQLAGLKDTGDEALDAVARKIREDWQIEHLVISLAAQGMRLFSATADNYHMPTCAREVYDVSGAGDTAIAAMAVILAAGGTVKQAMQVANAAAGIAVGKLGTATVTVAEVTTELKHLGI